MKTRVGWMFVLVSIWASACATPRVLEWQAPEGVDQPLRFRGEPQTLERALRTLVVGVRHPEKIPPPMLGAVKLEYGVGAFWPRFPWRRGVTYRAHYAGAVFDFSLEREQAPGTRVVRVFPSGTQVPENLLRVYLEFSHPMTQGRSLEHVWLLDERGGRCDGAFLQVQPELWDPEGRRLTLLLDPGRIKRGVQPNREKGLALESGKRFRLRIAGDWEDIEGVPLSEGFEKELFVGPPDRRSPRPEDWEFGGAPTAGTREPLHLLFDEALDRGGLETNLTVFDEAGRSLAGEVTIPNEEREWAFRPQRPWREGDYVVRVAEVVGDPAGNLLERSFETRPDTEEADRGGTTLGFSIR